MASAMPQVVHCNAALAAEVCLVKLPQRLPSGAKALPHRPCFGTTKVVPLRFHNSVYTICKTALACIIHERPLKCSGPTRGQTASAAFRLFSSPGLQAGVLGGIRSQAVLTAFLFSASALAGPRAEATFRMPAEAGWEKSGGFADPGVNAWAREKSHSFMNNPGPGLSSAKSKACTVI